MRVSLKAVPGVDSVEVSLEKGRASVKMKPGNSATLKQLNDAIAKEPRRPDTDHRKGMGLHINRGAYDAWIAGEIRLPGWIAEHQNRCSTGLVVAWHKRPARINAHTEGREVIPGNILRA